MASDDQDFIVTPGDGESGPQKKPTPGAGAKIMFALLIVLIVYKLFLSGDDTQPEQSKPTEDTQNELSDFDPEEAQRNADEEAEAQEDFDALSVDSADREGAIVALEKQQDSISQSVEKLSTRVVSSEDRVKEALEAYDNRFEKRMEELVDIIQAQVHGAAAERRSSIGGGPNVGREEVMNTPLDDDLPPALKESSDRQVIEFNGHKVVVDSNGRIVKSEKRLIVSGDGQPVEGGEVLDDGTIVDAQGQILRDAKIIEPSEITDEESDTKESQQRTTRSRAPERPAHLSQYGPEYVVLDESLAAQHMASSQGNPAGKAASGDSGDNPFQKPVEDAEDEEQALGQTRPSTARPDTSSSEKTEKETKNNNDSEDEEGPDSETKTVPAASFVEVTLLHGISCPIGMSMLNNSGGESSGNVKPAPFVLPVRGKFKGPNGAIYDMGRAHLMGVCRGSYSDGGRAQLDVEQISYWNKNGEAQVIETPGYVIDMNDKRTHLDAEVISTNGSDMAVAAGAAALNAFGSTVSAKEYTTQSYGESGSSSSVLTGDEVKAGLGEGFGESAKMISEYWLSKAKANVDVAFVESGRIMKFINIEPIKYKAPYEEFPEMTSESEPLI